jgi:eukaryotic-like serine/threonine-protein kinase
MANAREAVPDDREERLNAAILAYLSARAAGRAPEPVPFLGAYPLDLRDELASFLEAQSAIDAALAEHGRPTAFGHYDVVRPIKKGGFGEIYLCRDRVLNRPVAVKVLKAEHAARPDLALRFQEEAQIAAQLQHPGIPPVHELGRLPAGRPYFCMKLIQGRDLAEELRERASPTAHLPRFLAIFEQICQAVAYAHREKNVLHRDLKPLNVMVGAFGEVQVMDWGLGKVLQGEDGIGPTAEWVETVRTTTPEGQTEPGVVWGTFAYMPPEQARGERDRQGTWSDVFSLGAILCEILTGEPPYTVPAGLTPKEARDRLWQMAKDADLGQARTRLEGCGAEAELIQLALKCLTVEPESRLQDAQAVAQEIAAYLSAVQEKLRQAERERARAEARAEEAKATARAEQARAKEAEAREAAERSQAEEAQARATAEQGRAQEAEAKEAAQRARATEAEARAAAERRARRLTAGLAAAVVALVLLGGGVWLWAERAEAARRDQAALAAREWQERVNARLDEARELREQARRAAPSERGRLAAKALAAAERADALLAEGKPDPALRDRVGKFLAELREEERQRRAAERDRLMAERLARVRLSQTVVEDNSFRQDRGDEEYRAAFRDYGIDIEALSAAEAAKRIRRGAIQRELVAALDDWLMIRRVVTHPKRPEAWQPLAAAAQAVDRDPWRKRLRDALLAPERDQAVLGKLAETADFAVQPPETLVNLHMLLLGVDPPAAVALLRKAQQHYPDNCNINSSLGLCYHNGFGTPRRPDEAMRFHSAALALSPRSPGMHLNLGNALASLGRDDEALAAFDEAIRLKEDYAEAHNARGAALARKKEYGKALEAHYKALAIHKKVATTDSVKPDLLARGRKSYAVLGSATAWCNISFVLARQGKFAEAERASREAIRLDPDDPHAYYNLGFCCAKQSKWREAEDAYRTALKKFDEPLDPQRPPLTSALEYQGFRIFRPEAYKHVCLRLGELLLLHRQKPQPAEALAVFEKGLKWFPGDPDGHFGRGLALQALGKFAEALAAFRKVREVAPPHHPVHGPAKAGVESCQQFLTLDEKLYAIRRGGPKPAGAAELLGLAYLCQQYKGRYADAARFYADAFAVEPNLADDLRMPHRYNGACAAALAAAGKGHDAGKLDDKERVRLRKQALTWLRADLDAYTRLVENADARQKVRKSLMHWLKDAALAGVRDPMSPAALPEAERKAWQKLWADVAALLRKAEDE